MSWSEICIFVFVAIIVARMLYGSVGVILLAGTALAIYWGIAMEVDWGWAEQQRVTIQSSQPSEVQCARVILARPSQPDIECINERGNRVVVATFVEQLPKSTMPNIAVEQRICTPEGECGIILEIFGTGNDRIVSISWKDGSNRRPTEHISTILYWRNDHE